MAFHPVYSTYSTNDVISPLLCFAKISFFADTLAMQLSKGPRNQQQCQHSLHHDHGDDKGY